MSRHRDIAASPARNPAQAWDVVCDLLASTLSRSPNLDQATIATSLSSIVSAGRALVATGALTREPLTLVAEPLRLTISTVESDGALDLLEDENLNPVPGAATATDWTLYLPAPDGLANLVVSDAAGVPHVSIEPPPEEAASSKAAQPTVVDLRRLDPRARN